METPNVNLRWDTNTGVAVLVLGAVALLFVLERVFRGYNP